MFLYCLGISQDAAEMDVIDKVGPKDHFPSELHMLHCFPDKFWFAGLTNRKNLQGELKSKRKKDDKVNEKVNSILREN